MEESSHVDNEVNLKGRNTELSFHGGRSFDLLVTPSGVHIRKRVLMSLRDRQQVTDFCQRSIQTDQNINKNRPSVQSIVNKTVPIFVKRLKNFLSIINFIFVTTKNRYRHAI